MELRKSGSEGENDCCFTFHASHGCAKTTGIAGIEPVSFISCIFPEYLSSTLNLRTFLLLEMLIPSSGASVQPPMQFLGSTLLPIPPLPPLTWSPFRWEVEHRGQCHDPAERSEGEAEGVP